MDIAILVLDDKPPGSEIRKEEALKQTTSALHLLRELTELGNLVFGMFAGPHVTVRHWPVYYRLYVEVDGLCREVNRLAGHFARGFIDAGDTVDAERIAVANACLARVDGHVRAMAALLAEVVRDRLVIPGNPALLQIVDRHFSPRSCWYRGLQEHYRSGCIAPDGRTLARTVLPIDLHAAQWREGETTVEQQQFELSSMQARTLNGRTIRQVQTALNQVYAALGKCFVERCPSVGALMHPRSTPGPASMGFFYSDRTLREVHALVADLPGGLAVYVSRDHTFATIGTRGIRPLDGTRGLVIHVTVDITQDEPAKPDPRFIPAQSCHNGEYTAANADELKALLFRALIDAGLVSPNARFDDEHWRYF
jgi:hypothetical protein